MHDSLHKYVEAKVLQRQLQDKNVLEVGSLNVNGSIRQLFTGNYLGVDMREGEGVDQVCNAHALSIENESFDVIVSVEMLEHDDMFWLSIAEMGRVLKPNGYFILTARGIKFGKHAFPSDYYRFTTEAFNILFELAGCKPLEIIEDPDFSGVFGIGIKCS